MFSKILFLTTFGVISVSAQFFNVEYAPESAYLQLSRVSDRNARYEVQPSVGHEIEYPGVETARTPLQGRRHIDTYQRDAQNNQPRHGNVNTFELKSDQEAYQNDRRNSQTREESFYPGTGQFTNNREDVNYNQFNSQPQHDRVHASNDRENNAQRNAGSFRNDNQDRSNTNAQQNLASNINIDATYNQQEHLGNDNRRTDVNPIDQIQYNEDNSKTYSTNNDRYYDNTRQYTNPPTNAEDYEQNRSNGGVQTNYENGGQAPEPLTRQTNRNYESDNQNIYQPTGSNVNRHTTKASSKKITSSNKNYGYIETTETSTRKIESHHRGRKIASSTKSTKDNELASKGREDKDGDKWIWGNAEENRTSTPKVPAVDDRAAFAGDKCPTGQVRFNNMCVNTD